MIHVARSAELRPSADGSEIRRATELGEAPVVGAQQWAPRQRITELSGPLARTGRTSAAVAEVLRAQRDGEPCAWIDQTGELFPPDLEASGVDLAHLVVIRLEPSQGRAAIYRAAELLLRSGAFGLVVLDGKAAEHGHSSRAGLARLHALAREHDASVILLSRQPVQSPLIGVRIRPSLERDGAGVTLRAEVLRNKAGIRPGSKRMAMPDDMVDPKAESIGLPEESTEEQHACA